MAERTRGSPFATAFQSSDTGSQDWRVREGASRVNSGETQGQGPMHTHCPQGDLPAGDSLPPLDPGLAAWRAVASAWGEAQCSGALGMPPSGAVEDSRSHSGLPLTESLFIFPAFRHRQTRTRGKKSVNHYAHFIINFNNLRVWYGFIIVFISPY